MNCCNPSLSEDQKEAKKVNDAIDKTIRTQKRSNRRFNLLLLGTGDAGKTTFMKQMKVLHGEGINQEELGKFVDILRDNCLTAMQKLLHPPENVIKIEIPRKYQVEADNVSNAAKLTEAIAKDIKKLLKCDLIVKVMQKHYLLQLPGGISGVEYYFEHVKRFARKDFVPTEEDVMRAKWRTTGLSQNEFSIGSHDFVMVDVGGQRSERKKWLSCFVDVYAVMYLAALNEFNMMLEEDQDTNRMEESLKLFNKLTGSQWFIDKPVILFLNKHDAFIKQIAQTPLNQTFEDFDEFAAKKKGTNVEELSFQFIKYQYETAFSGKKGNLYTFATCAIDKSNCQRVFGVVRQNIIENSLDNEVL